MGRSDLRRAESLVANILVHVLKCCSTSSARLAKGWEKEIGEFVSQLTGTLTPSLRRKIDVSKVWERSCRQASEALAPYGESLIAGLPIDCPFSIDDLVDDLAADVLIGRIMIVADRAAS